MNVMWLTNMSGDAYICGHSKDGSVDISSTHDYADWIPLSVTFIVYRQRIRASISDQASPRLIGTFEAHHTNHLKEIFGHDIMFSIDIHACHKCF